MNPMGYASITWGRNSSRCWRLITGWSKHTGGIRMLKTVVLDCSMLRRSPDLSFYRKALDGMHFSDVKCRAVKDYTDIFEEDFLSCLVPLFSYFSFLILTLSLISPRWGITMHWTARMAGICLLACRFCRLPFGFSQKCTSISAGFLCSTCQS